MSYKNTFKLMYSEDVLPNVANLEAVLKKADHHGQSILNEYKFYLAFENALCEDYITEKYWARLGE